MAVSSYRRELLVVDGYNVIHGIPRYEKLVYTSSPDRLSNDIHVRAREALINDVASFAIGKYDAVIVFDGAGNVDPERNTTHTAGIRVVFSPTGVSADYVIEDLCTREREAGRPCSLVTSDATIQAVAMGKGVTRISARMLAEELHVLDKDISHEIEDAKPMKLTMADRLSPEMREKLDILRGRKK